MAHWIAQGIIRLFARLKLDQDKKYFFGQRFANFRKFWTSVQQADKEWRQKINKDVKGNYFINSVIHRSNAPIAFDSDGVLIENSLFSDIEWQVNSNGGSGSVMFGKNAIFRRNTVQRGGNCEGIRAIDNGSVIMVSGVHYKHTAISLPNTSMYIDATTMGTA